MRDSATAAMRESEVEAAFAEAERIYSEVRAKVAVNELPEVEATVEQAQGKGKAQVCPNNRLRQSFRICDLTRRGHCLLVPSTWRPQNRSKV